MRLYNPEPQTNRRRALRKAMPAAEAILWRKLRNCQLLNLKFHRQYGIGPYIVDFYCNALSLAIELDGDSHGTEHAQQQDKLRDATLQATGITTLRIPNTEVRHNLETVLQQIAAHLLPSLSQEGQGQVRQNSAVPHFPKPQTSLCIHGLVHIAL